MAAKDQLTQTREKLQTNRDANSPPEDSSFHLVSLDQKVKKTQPGRKRIGAAPQAELPGAAFSNRICSTPLLYCSPSTRRQRAGRKGVHLGNCPGDQLSHFSGKPAHSTYMSHDWITQ